MLILLVKSQAIWLINPSVCKELNKYRELGLAASEIESLDQYALHQLFSDAPPKELTKKKPRYERLEPLLPGIIKALRRREMTI